MITDERPVDQMEVVSLVPRHEAGASVCESCPDGVYHVLILFLYSGMFYGSGCLLA
jgi:hypothetical protein